ncbi:MAG TPA: CvpA family protein [Ramlibacter sp.]|nr:CvpA family protein [Ramlibacter sp.]
MNPIDGLLIVVVLISALVGSRTGFIMAALNLLTLASSLLLAYLGYGYLADWLREQVPSLGEWSLPLSFLAAFIVTHVVLGAAADTVIHAVPPRVHAAGANRVLGVMPGFATGLINATVVALIVLTVPRIGSLSTLALDSAIADRLSRPAEWLEAKLAPIFDPAVQRTLQALTVQPQSRTSVPLDFKVASPKVRTDLEARMLEMVNAERAKQGLKALAPDPQLAEVARAHSRDMFARGYFSHLTPEGKDPFDRMRADDVRFLAAGENLALAPTLPGAHQLLMNSPGHRANVLRPQFGRLGVGVLDGGSQGLMITQDFRN